VVKFKDFDEAIEADKKEELQIKVAGTTYNLPATLPAKAVLQQMRIADDGNDVPFEAVPQWIASLVGQDKLDEMLENGMSWEQMNDLLNWLMEAYGLAAPQESAEGVEGDEDTPK
jgi:hypothetical protein